MLSNKRLKHSKETKESADVEKIVDEVMVDFAGFSPQSYDSDGIVLLLKQLFVKQYIDLRELVGLIVSQQNVGSLIKQAYDDTISDEDSDVSDEDVVYGITTVISLSKTTEMNCIQQLKTLIITLAEQNADKVTLQFISDVFSNPNYNVGFLINERFMNIPQAVSKPAWHQLFKEIKSVGSKNDSFKFTHFILISKFSKVVESKEKPKHDNSQESVGDIVWYNPEEDKFVHEVEYSFDYCLKDDSDAGLCGKWSHSDKEAIRYRKCLIMSVDTFNNIIKSHFHP